MLAAAATLGAHAQAGEYAIAVHGGAGNFRPSELPAETLAQRRAALEASLEAGRKVLAAGGSSVEAVVAAVRVLEDSPHFNAGRGSVLTADGTVEMDASLMEGRGRRAGAVTGVTTVRNPVTAARAVMENSGHVMLAGAGAERFAREQGLETVAPAWFHTPERLEQLQRAKARGDRPSGEDASPRSSTPGTGAEKYGTVGAVALDRDGNLAAATSTGGIVRKRAGRVGDSPVIGAGTWADNDTVAVSMTGTGEAILRAAAAHDIAALVRYKGYTPQKAADEVMGKVKLLDGRAGAIVMDRSGEAVFSFNTTGMYRGHARGMAPAQVLVFR